MRAIAWLLRNRSEVAGALLAALAVSAIALEETWSQGLAAALVVLIFLGMVWEDRRRQSALAEIQSVAAMRATLLDRQERFLHDASHELRTPVTIARGHLELLRRDQPETPELEVALDELGRIERIVERLLLLAKSEQRGFALAETDIEEFLSDLFIRWSEVAPRAWRLDIDVGGRILADQEALRNALDALLENAVKYTDPGDTIELAARADGVGSGVVVEVSDSGCGVPPEALPRLFDRWARADDARTRDRGGAGLGLAIVAAVARAHSGRCSVKPLERGTAFRLHLPVQTRYGGAMSPTAVAAERGMGDPEPEPALARQD